MTPFLQSHCAASLSVLVSVHAGSGSYEDYICSSVPPWTHIIMTQSLCLVKDLNLCAHVCVLFFFSFSHALYDWTGLDSVCVFVTFSQGYVCTLVALNQL